VGARLRLQGWPLLPLLLSPGRCRKIHIGVAIGDSPSGPFVDIGNPIAGTSGIDPSLSLDEDGQGYLIWQDHGPVIARMKPNLIELAEAPHKEEGADNFFEGPWIFKRNQLYHLTYPAFRPGGTGGGQGQNYDYAISGKPTGPYVYKGAYAQSGPGGDNIHGSQLEWNGKWYYFYHDFSTSVGRPGHGYRRAVKMDELRFAGDGSILPLQWTAEGPSQQKPLDALSRVEAETLNSTDIPEGDHAIAIDGGSHGPVYLGPATSGSWVKYARIDFGSGASQFQARVASATGGGVIDRIDGPLVGSFTVRYTGGWQQWTIEACAVNRTSGLHDLLLVFRGDGRDGLFNIDWFTFSRAGDHP